jgi:hypothetical protein
MRRRLHLVGNNDPTNQGAQTVFDDLDSLRRTTLSVVSTRRARSTETFARFPHERALALCGQIDANGWVLLVEIDWQILKGRGRNPVRLTNHRIRELGISRWTKQRQLQLLQAAGVLKVETEGRKWTVVTHLWFPVQA